MTTPDTEAQHPSLDQLSDLVEGVLDEPDQARVARHIGDCSRCHLTVEELRGLRGLLQRAAADQPPMPSSVTDRLDAALAAESAQRSRDTGVSSLRTHRRHRSSARSKGRLGRAFAAAAGVAVLAVGGGVAYQSLTGPSGPTGGTAAERETNSPGRGGAPTAFSLAGGKVRLSSEGFDDEVRQAVRPDSQAADTKGDTKADTGADSKSDDRTDAKSPDPSDGPLRPSDDPGIMGRTTGEQQCLAKAMPGKAPILDTTSASYQGQPAILAITEGEQSGSVHAYVVVGCPGSGEVAHDATVRIDD